MINHVGSKGKLSVHTWWDSWQGIDYEVINKSFPYNKDHDKEIYIYVGWLTIMIAREKIGW